MTTEHRPVIYLGSSQKDLKALPVEVKEVFAQGLYVANQGGRPSDSKVLKGFHGASVIELREDHKSDTYRAVYTVKFKEALYVLHIFKKKSKKGITMPKKDKELLETRLKRAEQDYKERFGGKR